MAVQARQVIEEGRQKIAPLEERIRQHPYLQALEAKAVDAGRIHRAARMLQGYELLYWDTMLDATRA